MLGRLIDLGNSAGAERGDRLLNAVVSGAIARLFTSSETVTATVGYQNPGQLLQGSIDSLTVNGTGLVIRREFPVTDLWFETDRVALDFTQVPQGKISLQEPTRAIAKVTLTEANINRALKSTLVKQRLQDFPHIEVQLLPNQGMRIFAKAKLGAEYIPICLSAQVSNERRRRLILENPKLDLETIAPEWQNSAAKLSSTLIEALNQLVDVSRFNLDGVNLWLNRVEIEDKKLRFSGYAEITHFPRRG